MHKRILIILFASLAVLGCGETEINLQKRNSNITIDGKLNDWDTKSFGSYFDDKVRMKAVYDDENIYLGGECLDRQIGRRFALNGIVIWIDPEGRKNKDLELNVKYKGERKFDFTKGNFYASLNEEQKNKALKELDKINDGLLIVDKKNMESLVFPENDSSSFRGQMLIEGGKLTFEFKIPRYINRLFSDFKDINFDESLLGISYGQASFRRNMGMMRPEISPGSSEGPGAMPTRGRGGRGMTDFSNEDSELWVKLNASDK